MFNPQPKPTKQAKDLHNFAKAMTKPIRKVSKVRAKELKTYFQKRNDYLQVHPTCQAKLIGCTRTASDVHHSAGRSGSKLNDEKFFLALCRHCHGLIHDKLSATELRAKGLKK